MQYITPNTVAITISAIPVSDRSIRGYLRRTVIPFHSPGAYLHQKTSAVYSEPSDSDNYTKAYPGSHEHWGTIIFLVVSWWQRCQCRHIHDVRMPLTPVSVDFVSNPVGRSRVQPVLPRNNKAERNVLVSVKIPITERSERVVLPYVSALLYSKRGI